MYFNRIGRVEQSDIGRIYPRYLFRFIFIIRIRRSDTVILIIKLNKGAGIKDSLSISNSIVSYFLYGKYLEKLYAVIINKQEQRKLIILLFILIL